MIKPVSFELAKLVKEKKFDDICQKWYSVEGGLYDQDEFDNNRGFVPVFECEAPTIAEVVMWLYEKHGIWIEVVHRTLWAFSIKNIKENVFELERLEFNSLTEAYEAAIEYTLKNLI